MSRPKKSRWVAANPNVSYFKPQGIPLRVLQQVELGVDELEALRLADWENLGQEEAAGRMNISRATFGRVVAQGRKKVADALVQGKAIRIEGGNIELRPQTPPCRHRGQHRRGRGLWHSTRETTHEK